jgi:hypothetical protein
VREKVVWLLTSPRCVGAEPIRAAGGHAATAAVSFDHLVGERQQLIGNIEAGRLGGVGAADCGPDRYRI